MLNIGDISAAQGCNARGNGIVWTDVARWIGDNGERLDAVVVKATEGNAYVDPAFVENSIGASAVELLLGWYHFAHPDNIHENDPIDEAAHFYGAVSSQGFEPGKHILALDIEEARQVAKGPAFVVWVLAFCDEVEKLAGVRCVIYTGGPFFDEESGEIDGATQVRIGRHPLWLAAYVTNPARYIPKAWREAGWVLHQDTGDQAPPGKKILHVAGIGGGHANVDHDEYLGTRDDLSSFVSSLVDMPATDPAPAPDVDPRLVPHHGGSSLADDVHDLPPPTPTDNPPITQPQGPVAIKRTSSPRTQAVDAPIIDPKKEGS